MNENGIIFAFQTKLSNEIAPEDLPATDKLAET